MPDPPVPSNISAGAAGAASGGGGVKKRFGKNLNRLVPAAAPRAPPPPTAIARLSSRTSTKTTGLAFLSSKTKSASGAGAAGADGVGSGKKGGESGNDGGGAKPVLAVAPEPKSAHDALLTAAAAEAGLVQYPRAEEQEIDAWGTVQQSKEQKELKEKAEKAKAEAAAAEEEQRRKKLQLAEDRKRELMERRRQRDEAAAAVVVAQSGTGSGVDNDTAAAASGSHKPDDTETPAESQPDAMARLARERAAARKAEEEERFRLQREGAARRLRELEEKMGANASSRATAAVDPTEVQNWRQRSRPQQLGTAIKLERLGGGNDAAGGKHSGDPSPKSIMAAAAAARKVQGGLSSPNNSKSKDALANRSLWDPNQGRTFSSLVGGSTTGVVPSAEDLGVGSSINGRAGGTGGGAEEHDPVSPLKDYDDSFDRGDGRGGGGRMIVDVDEYKRGGRRGGGGGGDRRRADSNASDRGRSNSNVSDYGRYAYEVEPPEMDRVIHVADFETTDRGEGERKAEAPRLLFDPTTGSMVAAKDIPAEKKTKKSKKERKSRSAAGDGGPLLLRRPDDNDDSGGKSSRKGGKKERTKRGDEAKAAKKSSRSSKSQPKLPRTCGVLYRRDDRGRFVCADGCDADQGYGAHSVPGGKIRNPAGHAAFVKEQKRLEEEVAAYRASLSRGDGGYYGNGGYQQGDDYGQDYMGGYDGYGGFGGGDAGAMKEEELVAPEVALVKADEDLKLMVGEDSPTLKPSAREFAPSQAALAAASSAPAHSAKNGKSNDATVKSNTNAFAALYYDDDDDDTEDDDDDHAIGLGFDPTQNMDAVMMSPAGSPSKGKVEVEAEPFELAMGQMTVMETEDADGSPRMPFSGRRAGKSDASRLLSAGWSISETGGGNGDGAATNERGKTTFSTAFGNWNVTATEGGEEEATDHKMPASFLTLSEQFGSSEDLVGIGTILDDLDTEKEEENGD